MMTSKEIINNEKRKRIRNEKRVNREIESQRTKGE